jgi:hypothetical protein
MKIIALFLTLICTLPLLAQRSKNKTPEITPPAFSEGITYALPRTAIRITVEARQTQLTPGPYAAYADPMLGIKNAPVQPRSVWVMTRISFDTFSEPDPACVFKTSSQVPPLVQLSANGCIAGFNSNFPGKTDNALVTNSFLSGGDGQSAVFANAVQLPASSGKTPVEQRATEAAAHILKSRTARYDIVAGLLDEHHPDGKAYEASLEELRKSEKETVELFTGRHQTENFTFTYSFIPSGKPVKGEVLFRFDESLGFLAKNDFSGKPVTIDVEPEETPAAGTENAANPESGLYYRNPGVGNVKLTRELTVIATARIPVAQFGSLLTLPEELLNGGYSIEYYPETGTVRSISKK